MSLPQHPDHADTATDASRRSKRWGIAIGVGVLVLMAGIHLLRQAL